VSGFHGRCLRDLGEYVQASIVADVLDVAVDDDELCIIVRRDSVARVLTFLRDDMNCQFKQLMDVCGVDYPGAPSDSRWSTIC
jgi:NADH-quinone oxidoreductase subunit C